MAYLPMYLSECFVRSSDRSAYFLFFVVEAAVEILPAECSMEAVVCAEYLQHVVGSVAVEFPSLPED